MDDGIPEGYRMTELGALPEGWDVVRLGGISNIKMGQSPPSSSYNNSSDGLPFFQGNADFGTKFPIVRSYCNEPLKVADVDDILISVRAPVGAINISNVRCCIGRGLAAISADENNSQAFMYYLLQSCVATLNKFASGSTFTAINQKELNSLLIPLPPLPEQRRIAAILSTVDETVERTEALIEKYRNIKSGLMADLLTRGIDEEGRIRSEETHRFKDSALGRVPEEWTIKILEDVATLQRGFDLPVQSRKPGRIPVYGSNGIDGWHSNVGVRGPGVVTGRSGSIGFVYYSDVDFWPLNTTLYVKNLHGNNPQFIWRLLQSLRLERFVAATGVPSLNRNFVHPTLVQVPPLPEQRRIAEVLTAADQRIEKEEAYRNKLLQIKKGLMQDLLTGRVRVKPDNIQKSF